MTYRQALIAASERCIVEREVNATLGSDYLCERNKRAKLRWQYRQLMHLQGKIFPDPKGKP